MTDTTEENGGNDVQVKFLHPFDGSTIDAELGLGMQAEEVIAALIAEKFIEPWKDGYSLAVKGGSKLLDDVSFADQGLQDGDIIRIIPNTSAGGGGLLDQRESEASSLALLGIPGLRRSSGDTFTIKDVQKSPEAIIMIAHMFENLQMRHEKQAKELEAERLRSHSRLTAALLLLVSQVVLSVGGNLLTQNLSIGIAVIVAGSLQALLAIFLTFKRPDSR